VSALFCDLVGFTAASEQADPEDLDRMLGAYFDVARAQIEAHGGVVEKFIGDAVVGVFGVQAAHEDDPERAVRAGLRIVEAAEGLHGVGGAPLRLRIGINTGEALVRVGIAAASGEGFVTGDAVNTAARIQAVAPAMGVAVGHPTYQATSTVFEYAELEPAEIRGKAEPVRIFQARAPRARLGTDLTRRHDGPYVGRGAELAALTEAFDSAIESESVRFVTVVGEPGMGKSRIVAELAGDVDGRHELFTWRQGRCLPYGDGIAFWALGEIVKAHAGILESDPPELAVAKLDGVLAAGVEREWLRQRLLPLLGIESSSPAERQELFTAWRRFLEQIAGERPTVLVFEDLHWADDSLLAFLDELVGASRAVPLLVVGTVRPELFERRPGALATATVIRLAPLAPEDAARLVSGLLGATMLPAELQQPILERTGGNPLFARELVGLLKDRDLLVPAGSSWQLREGAALPLPDSVQAVIAARLDTLDPVAKAAIGDAAVVGKVFWASAVASMSDRPLADVAPALDELVRRDLIAPVRRSSLQGEAEYAFGHVLVRDAAYGRLPRRGRAARHVAAARWIEARIGDRADDLADVLAHHYATALDLSRATGQADQAAELEPLALHYLTLAGERALGLDTSAALSHFQRALPLTPPGHPRRPRTLAGLGEACFHDERPADAFAALEEAIDGYRAAGDARGAARVTVTLSGAFSIDVTTRRLALLEQALALLEPLPPTPELVSVLAELADCEALHGRPEVGVPHAERALALAEQLGLGRHAPALGYRALCRAKLGDPRAFDDWPEAIALATEAGLAHVACHHMNNCAVYLTRRKGPAAGLELYEQGLAYAEARGIASWVSFISANLAGVYNALGQTERAEAIWAAQAKRAEATGNRRELMHVRVREITRLLDRGRLDLIDPATLEWLENQTGDTVTPKHNVNCLVPVMRARAGYGEAEAAVGLLLRMAAFPATEYIGSLPSLVRTALELGRPDVAERFVDQYDGTGETLPGFAPALEHSRALLAEERGDYEAAAACFADALERGRALGRIAPPPSSLLGLGRVLLALGRPTEAVEPLRAARDGFERLDMAPSVEEADTLLQEATTLTA
jgi:class 3 adenylate cyclase/tetratricopeptide (TPR) repeat protein